MRKVIKIVTFYDDGTFTESVPSPAYMPTYPAPNTPYHPSFPPTTNPWPQPPYTITCKAEDGTTKTIETGPIIAQSNT